MMWLNILLGFIAGVVALITLSLILSKNPILVRIISVIVMLVFIQILNLYFSTYFTAWQTIYHIKNIPFYNTVEKSDPLLFDEFISKIYDNALRKGNSLNVMKYRDELTTIMLHKYLGKASDDTIYNYLQANIKIYEALNKVNPGIILMLEEKTQPTMQELTILNSIDPNLLNNLLESANQIIISASIDPQPPSDANDAENREGQIISVLSKKYSQDMITKVFSNTKDTSLNKQLVADIIIDMYKTLIESGKENVGIIIRAVYGNTADNINSLANNTTISKAETVYQKVSDSVYTVYSENTQNAKYGVLGSGVAIDKNILATNCHVALSEKYMIVRLDDTLSPAKLFYKNGDMCLIQIISANFKPVKIRPSNEVNIGEEVFAIGNPEGYEKTISQGIISNKYTSEDGQYVILQTDAAISQGSSGGGLFDTNGNLIGITTAISRYGSNIGFVIPTELITDGTAKSTFIDKVVKAKGMN